MILPVCLLIKSLIIKSSYMKMICVILSIYVFLTDLELWPDCELPESHFHLCLPDDPDV